MKAQKKEMDTKEKIKQSIILQIQVQKSTTSLSFGELSEEEREKVQQYVANIDKASGEEEIQSIYEEIDLSIKTIQTDDLSVNDKIRELMRLIGDYDEQETSSFRVIRTLKNKVRKTGGKYRRAKVISNIDSIKQKLEELRCELRINSEKLEYMSQSFTNRFKNMQYQLIALQELLNRMSAGIQIDEKSIKTKIEKSQNLCISLETNAKLLKFLAIYNDKLARCYEQKIPIIDVTEGKTSKRLTSNVIESVRELRDIQERGKLKNEAFVEIITELRDKLAKELGIGQEVKTEEQEGTDR